MLLITQKRFKSAKFQFIYDFLLKGPLIFEVETQLFPIDLKCPQCFFFFKYKKTNKSDSDFRWWTPSASPVSAHWGQDIEISFSEPCAKVRHPVPKLCNKQFTKKKIFFISILSTGLPRPRLLSKIVARWRYRLHINNLIAHYNSQFGVRFHFCINQEAGRRISTRVNMGPKPMLDSFKK